jgi:hypothetical protein
MKKVTVAFTADDLAPVEAALDPAGWVNLEPDVDDPPPEPRKGWFGSVFSNRGPMLPFATWHPGERSAGLQHDTGPKLARRVEIPPGWRVAHDHPRRGLVLRVPEGVTDAEVLRWLVDTGEALSPIETFRKWHAVVVTP